MMAFTTAFDEAALAAAVRRMPWPRAHRPRKMLLDRFGDERAPWTCTLRGTVYHFLARSTTPETAVCNVVCAWADDLVANKRLTEEGASVIRKMIVKAVLN